MNRVICLVADGFGVGAAPDASDYGDEGSNTLAHIALAVGGLNLPTLEKLGMGNLTATQGILPQGKPQALVARLAEKSAGKDTTTGHWELAGLVTKKPFTLFPDGFPEKLLKEFAREAGVAGSLGNRAASGTIIIDELGEEHLATGKPIVYTSGDSVFQIAASEETFGLEKLYQVCEAARRVTLPYQIGRVIARPFVGEKKGEFRRTEHRRDYSVSPGVNCLDVLTAKGIAVYSVGKIDDIFDHRGITAGDHTGNNADGFEATLRFVKESAGKPSLTFVNLVDFDMLYGHRRDPKGYAGALVALDKFLPRLFAQLDGNDCVMITADHGCDPTFRGTDHTREYVPFIAYRPGHAGAHLGDRGSMADVGTSILSAFGIPASELPDPGTAIL